jgi:hypothetical protein
MEVILMNKVEVSGFWNIPDYEGNDVEGVLYLNPIEGILSLLLYSSKSIGLMRNIEIITGRTTQGSEITLYGCYVAKENIRIGINRKHESVVVVKYVFDGITSKSNEKLLFHEVNFRFSNLDEWAFIQGFELHTIESCNFSVIHRHPESVICKIDEETTISINTELVSPLAIVNKEVKATQRVYVSIQYKSPKPIEKSIEVIKSFMGLVSLGIGRSVSFTEIFGFNPNHFQSWNESDRKHYYKLRVYTNEFSDENYTAIDPRDVLLNLQEMGSEFEKILKSW